MSVERDIFDLEGVLEDAFEADLNVLEIAVRIPNSDPEFQSERSRVEVFVKQGRWTGGLKAQMGQAATPGAMRETTFDGAMRVMIITRADYDVHRTFRAAVRNRMSQCIGRLNKTLLTRHKLHWVETAGSEPDYASNQGRFETELNFNIKVSVQDNAWSDLEAEEAIKATVEQRFIQCDTGGAFALAAEIVDDEAVFSTTGENQVSAANVLLPNDSDGRFYEYRCRAADDLYLSQEPAEEEAAPGVYFRFGVNLYQMRCRTEVDEQGDGTRVAYLKLVG